MNNAWYELQIYTDAYGGWTNWRDDGMVYDSVEEALYDCADYTGENKLPRGYRVVEINAVLMGE